ncbi:NaeI family type II restriction endonuclease [Phaeobacter inhibens]|uniref:NaeI family type II restriction endonuclease n=1 Tax=Phaeobacter inhibens TaxID=221822 RepID=UPI000C9AA2F1|nr:NaeI family type II restriction endonuclease [Phaeobacter inhibens]AUQ61891.1 putative type 2 restriction enzyme naeI [Phaeobacter inhibens]AUQ81865.1 putative type 2 restriction enzyme naeI [Phaeobacter inhibens]AUQ89588.1 putative type 2 restriction enzyme naeI [Phaeobacter inhibens]AUR10929.1 putative type 2 restriction enzyme naeI [Phaeobacter inhibens]MDO6755647.1 NaeI family type II restriction endonuclease [Phaeobacter inhibens]
MKQKLPPSQVSPGHADHALLAAFAQDITTRAGGLMELTRSVPAMLRDCIDDVILTAKTGRRAYEDLEKTEKTYIGTRVEIELRALLRLPKGRLDTEILGHDVDIKHTMGSNWMIPTEAVDQPCILVAADEPRARCYLGLIVARRDYLTAGQNKDAKRSISAQGFENILWLLCDQPYPANFWRLLPEATVEDIFAGDSGNARMATLFRTVQRQPIPRDVVEAVAAQKDFMRRIRSDGGHGTRDLLARDGIVILEGRKDAQLIRALDLPHCSASEFISAQLTTLAEARLAASAGHAGCEDFFSQP